MKQVYIAADMIDAEIFKDYLLENGIAAVVKGAILAGIIGEIPANTYPTVWVEDDRDVDLARKYLAMYESGERENNSGEHWQCPACKETNEAQFGICWSCGGQKPQ